MKTKHWFIFILLGAIWSSSFMWIKIAVQEVGPITLGQLAVVLASAFYAGSAVYVRKTTEDTPGILRSAGSLLSATAVMWSAAFLFERPVEIPQLRITWVALLFLGILGSGLAFVLAYYLIHEIGPTRTSMVTYLFPLGGVILGVVLLNGRLSWQLLVGAALIISSLIVANWQVKYKAAINSKRLLLRFYISKTIDVYPATRSSP